MIERYDNISTLCTIISSHKTLYKPVDTNTTCEMAY